MLVIIKQESKFSIKRINNVAITHRIVAMIPIEENQSDRITSNHLQVENFFIFLM